MVIWSWITRTVTFQSYRYKKSNELQSIHTKESSLEEKEYQPLLRWTTRRHTHKIWQLVESFTSFKNTDSWLSFELCRVSRRRSEVFQDDGMNINSQDMNTVKSVLKKLPYQQTVSQFVSSLIQHYVSKLKKEKVIWKSLTSLIYKPFLWFKKKFLEIFFGPIPPGHSRTIGRNDWFDDLLVTVR